MALVWLLLAVLGLAIAALEVTDHLRSGRDGERDPRLLLSQAVDELGAIEIADRGRLHRFERDAAGSWFYHGAHGGSAAPHAHTADPALAERIARALAALGRARIEREFPLDRGGDAYGVTTPEVVVLAYGPGRSQPLAQYAVGHVAPDTVSRYVSVVGRPGVVTIPSYQIDNLRALVAAAEEAAGGSAPAAPPAPTNRR